MAALLLGVLMLIQNEKRPKNKIHILDGSVPHFSLKKKKSGTIAFLETLLYRTETYGHYSCKGVCEGSILAGHIATPNEIVFLLIIKKRERERKVEWILDKQLAISSIKPQGHYPRFFNKTTKQLLLFAHFIH